MTDADHVDLCARLAYQTTERYRAMLVIGEAASGKSKYARKLAERAGAGYVDLLGHFSGNPDLQENIDTFGVDQLMPLLKGLADGKPILIVDNSDFLLNAWSDNQRREFGQRLGKLDNVVCPVVLCFFVQADPAFRDTVFSPTTDGRQRICSFTELVAI
jgi:hypothetical protein